MQKNDLVEVFKDTIATYSTEYAGYTKELRKNDTFVYAVPNIAVYFEPNPNMNMYVVNGGTVETGKKFALSYDSLTFGKRTAILNFADGIEPGGLVLVGETTQEENICRCSNLYASLTTDRAWAEYYDYNATKFGIYSDRIIYSRNVLFFKDDVTYEREAPYFMDVITCPAPSQKIMDKQLEHDILYRRIEQIIKSAIDNDVNNLILGAWGCGAFGQNPEVVSRCFADVLMNYNAFDNVVFAIRSFRNDSSKIRNNYDAFYQTFGGKE